MTNLNTDHRLSLTPIAVALFFAFGCSAQAPQPKVPKTSQGEPDSNQKSIEQEIEESPLESHSENPRVFLSNKRPRVVPEMSSGSLAREDIAQSLSKRAPELKECYSSFEKKDPELQGKNIVRFQINSYGKVTKAETTYDQLGDEISKCIRHVIKGTDFPRPTGDHVTVLYPMYFLPTVSKTQSDNQPKHVRLLKQRPRILAEVDAGDMMPADISRVLNKNLGLLKLCVSETLDENSELSAKITFRFRIETDGSVSNAETTLNELDDDASSCLLKEISALQFPPPTAGHVTVIYPFFFGY